MDNKEIFSRNLKRIMEQKGVSRQDLSKVLGVSYFTISDWVNGKKYPRMDKVEMLAAYFGILKSDLIEGKGTNKTLPQVQTLTEEEVMLLEMFRQIPEEHQRVFLDMGRVYANSLKKD